MEKATLVDIGHRVFLVKGEIREAVTLSRVQGVIDALEETPQSKNLEVTITTLEIKDPYTIDDIEVDLEDAILKRKVEVLDVSVMELQGHQTAEYVEYLT